ncbi:MAG: amidohydrolase family protein [Variovorax sp.]
MKRSPQLPSGACDCHTHVFLDEAKFPLHPARRYTPPPASIEALTTLHDALGIERVVIVQPSVYGRDNAATLHALRTLGQGRARGVAVIDDDTSDAELAEMAAAGVRGVRVNLEVDGERDASKATAWLRRTVERVAPLGWHVQLYASLTLLGACADMLGSLPVPLVFDHYAGAQAHLGLQQEGVAEVLKLVESGRAYVKLSAPYRCAGPDALHTLEPLTRLLIDCNPDRMLWGSDWPHPQPGARPNATDVCPPFEVDLGETLNALATWARDDVTLQKILVDNPLRLYGFDA